jgi:YjbE family integral membrane protein
MGFDNVFHYLNLTLEVFLVDLLLSGDNAMVIALACRSLPPELTRRAMLIGIGAAIAMRILLTSVASFMLSIPMLKLVGGIALTIIAIQLIIEEEEETEADEIPGNRRPELWSAVSTIIVADLVMSVDNVVALAAVTQGSLLFLVIGLLMSVPLLMFGSLFVTNLLTRYPLLIRGGGALLGWLAGDIAISDPLIAAWVSQQAPALTVVVPIAVALFVLVESRIIETAKATASALRPQRSSRAETSKPLKAAIESAPAKIDLPPVPQTEVVKLPVSLPIPALVKSPIAPETPLIPPVEITAVEPVLPVRGQFLSRGAWIAAAVAAILAIAWLGISIVNSQWIPKPASLNRYLCPGKDVTVYFRHGAHTIQMSSATGKITGVMFYDKIEWDGGPTAAGNKLGFAPPTSVKYSDTRSLRMVGGGADEINCLVQPGP